MVSLVCDPSGTREAAPLAALVVVASLLDVVMGIAAYKFGLFVVGALRLTIFGFPQWMYVREVKKGIIARPGTEATAEEPTEEDEEEGNLQSPV